MPIVVHHSVLHGGLTPKVNLEELARELGCNGALGDGGEGLREPQREASVKYSMNYHYMPKQAPLPRHDGTTVEVEADWNGFALIPNVGDFVHHDNSMNGMASLDGNDQSRGFFYIRGSTPENAVCMINIMIEETDDDWGKLSKE